MIHFSYRRRKLDTGSSKFFLMQPNRLKIGFDEKLRPDSATGASLDAIIDWIGLKTARRTLRLRLQYL